MALLLSIETATKVCSVSLALNGAEVATEEFESEQYSHSEKLNLLILDLFKRTNYELKNIDGVAVSEGPGSYTGLRIGVSAAKGICYGLDVPLIAINSLKSLANNLGRKEMILCPMFDARRMEVFSAIYDFELNELEETRAVVIDEASYLHFLQNQKVCFFGPGAEKCQNMITHDNAIFDLDTRVSARGMMTLAEANYRQKEFVDTAYFEPFYLKDFIAGQPKKIF